jgi:hypothetical protein
MILVGRARIHPVVVVLSVGRLRMIVVLVTDTLAGTVVFSMKRDDDEYFVVVVGHETTPRHDVVVLTPTPFQWSDCK